MKTSISSTRKHAYVVWLSDLEKLYRLLEERVGSVTVRAQCSDEMKREFETWQEVACYDNVPSKKIMSLCLSANDFKLNTSAFINFHDGIESSIYMYVTG